MNPFEQLHQGTTLHLSRQQAVKAAQNSSSAPAGAEKLTYDPRMAETLPIFGMRLQQVDSYERVDGRDIHRRPLIWKEDVPFNHFWLYAQRTLHAAISTRVGEDGQIVQRITAEQARVAWKKYRDEYWRGGVASRIFGESPAKRPDDNHMPLHIAAMLAFFGGIPWSISSDGEAVERILPNQSLRDIPKQGPNQLRDPLPASLKNGLNFPCVGWCYLPPHGDEGENTLLYLTGVGPQKKLKAAWAALMDNKRDLMFLPSSETNRVTARRISGKGVYETFWNEDPLPESGLAHMVIQDRSMLHPRSGQPFLHLTGQDGLPDLALFARQLDAASTFPIQPSWVGPLWDQAITAALITKLPSYGCTGYWVNVANESEWGTLIARCAGAKTATIETYGGDEAAAAVVAEVQPEEDV